MLDAFIGMLVLFIAMFIAFAVYMPTLNKEIEKKTTSSYIRYDGQIAIKGEDCGPDSVQISYDMKFYVLRNYKYVETLYQSVGFTNVTVVPLNDLISITLLMNGMVDKVFINGSSGFGVGDVFPKDAKVCINYHCKP